MIKKLISAVAVFVLLAAAVTSAAASGVSAALDRLQAELENDPENGCFLAVALRQSEGDRDLTKFGLFIAAREIPKNPVTALKYALTLKACGVKSEVHDEYFSDPGNYPDSISGLVYTLHLIFNGFDTGKTAADVIKTLERRQTESGGFAVVGDSPDVDMTAMTVSALAPCKTDPTAAKIIEKAVAFIRSAQKENGTFDAFGGENAETTAQVVIALSSLGEKTDTLEKAYAAMLGFRLENGDYEHVKGGGANSSATAQCVSAQVAYERMSPFYALDKTEHTAVYSPSSGDLTLVFCLCIAAAGVIVCVVMLIRGKKRIIDYIIVLSVTAVTVAVIAVVGVRTGKGYFENVEEVAVTGNITFSVDCSLVSDKKLIEKMQIGIGEGDTAYSVLIRVCRQNGLTVINSGSPVSPYITGIGGVYEAEYGQTSGWGYKVNGVAPSVGSGSYKLQDGDVLEWIYVPDVSLLY